MRKTIVGAQVSMDGVRDIADVKRLKQEDGPNLVTQGSTTRPRAACQRPC